MRADRLLSILLLLQVNRRMTASSLAKRLEVSARTIHRDMEALSMAGVPVYAERGAGGGWVLPDDYRTDVAGLTEGEVQALFVAAPARLLADLGLEKAAEGAVVKLLAALPSLARRDAEQVRQRIHVDGDGWRQADEEVPALATLQEAVWLDRKVRLAYRRNDGQTVERTVDPLGLVAKGRLWYLVAGTADGLRTYRVSRVEHAEILDEPAARPLDFDLAAFWSTSTAELVAKLPRYQICVRVAPEAVQRLAPPGSYARVEEMAEPDGDGWRTVVLDLQTEWNACSYVLGFGPHMQVVAPAELRERVVHEARAMLALYGRQQEGSFVLAGIQEPVGEDRGPGSGGGASSGSGN